MGNQAAKKAQKNSNQTRGRNWMVKWNDTWRLRRQGLEPSLKNEPIKRPVLSTKTLASLAVARVSAGERGRARAAFWKSRGARAEKNAWLITYFNSLIILARILLEFDKLIRYGSFIAKFSRTFCVFWALVIHPTCQLADGRSGEGVGSVVSFPNIQIACLWKKSRMCPGKFLYYKKSFGRTERPSMSALQILKPDQII